MSKPDEELKREPAKKSRSNHLTVEQIGAELLESIPDPFIAFDREGRYIYVNRAAERLANRNREEMLGQTVFEVFSENSPKFDRAFRGAVEKGLVSHYENYFLPLKKWFEITVYPSANGAILYAKDITVRKKTEEALWASEERFRRYFELGLIGMAITSPTKGIIEVNDKICEILNYSRFELLQKTWAELTHPEDLPANLSNFNRVLAGEIDGYSMDKRFIRKDGKIIYATISVTCMRHGDGSVDYFVSLLEDITIRKQADLERQKFVLLANNSTEYNSICDLEYKLTYANPAALKIAGLDSLEQVSQTHVWDYFFPEDQNFIKNEFLPCVMRDGYCEKEIRFRHFKTGEPIWMIFTAFVIKDEFDQPIGYGTISRDITERKRAEEALREAQAELVHVTRVLTIGEMASSIAHEVNQPLGAIATNGGACLRFLMHDLMPLNEVREALESIIRDARRASEVIQRIRALVKKTASEKAWLNINETIQDVIGLTARELAKNQVIVRTDLEADLPTVLVDRIQLQQVLLNLILNAKEAMSRFDWQPRELLIRSQNSTADEIMVAVSDSGIGLNPRVGEQIFDPFFTTKENGLGLGLSISRTIIEAHGGRLWVTPNEGKGATFHFTLSTRGGF